MKEKREKTKILYFVDRMLRGGIQTFILENMRYMDWDKIQIDLLLLDDGKHYELEDAIAAVGATVYKLNGIWLKKPTDYFYYQSAVNTFFEKHHDYDVIHLHSSSKNWLILYFAKKYGIKTRIAHSHNIGFQTTSKMQLLLANSFKPLLKRYATDYFACSRDAGKWLFGNEKVTVIHNAVDLDRFRFSEEKRQRQRCKLGLSDELVIGHVGRFTEQKNHSFLIDIFSCVVKRNPEAKLLLVGEGKDEEKIRDQARKLGILNQIIFAGFCSNVEDYLSAIDVFVFPSKFEGLGLVLIEAQANGLHCFTSQDVVPSEAKVSDLLQYISLELTPMEWAEHILKSRIEHDNVEHEMIEAGYRIEDTSKYLEKFYLKHSEGKRSE